MKQLDELIIQNSKGLLSYSERWDMKLNIENSIESMDYCIACMKVYPEMPSKSIIDSDYCKGHLRYAMATGINPYNFFK